MTAAHSNSSASSPPLRAEKAAPSSPPHNLEHGVPHDVVPRKAHVPPRYLRTAGIFRREDAREEGGAELGVCRRARHAPVPLLQHESAQRRCTRSREDAVQPHHSVQTHDGCRVLALHQGHERGRAVVVAAKGTPLLPRTTRDV